ELGNAAWKLLHTILARYPENPSSEERSYLEQYIFYFGKVYPCGDCARHFAKLLKKYPPQTSSRQTAAVWGCHIHNKVNERLGHDLYDCSHIIEDYDCGCGEDEQLPDGTRSEGPNRLDFDIQQEQRQHG
ncbi:flavin-linked sulfhydryl oxidase CYBJADRAFT_129508, partial [Cyberlindnera jadinii NRRL Y-1542]